jgi:hypothetical protein
MAGLMIGELARQAGVATSALRYYEKVGLLPPPAIEAGFDGVEIVGRFANSSILEVEVTPTRRHPGALPPSC